MKACLRQAGQRYRSEEGFLARSGLGMTELCVSQRNSGGWAAFRQAQDKLHSKAATRERPQVQNRHLGHPAETLTTQERPASEGGRYTGKTLRLGEKDTEVAEVVAGGSGDDGVIELEEKGIGVALAEGHRGI